MPAEERWRDYAPPGQPPVRTLVITIGETVKGLDSLLGQLVAEAKTCELSEGLHLDHVAHVDRPKAHAQVSEANRLLQEALGRIRAAQRQLSHNP